MLAGVSGVYHSEGTCLGWHLYQSEVALFLHAAVILRLPHTTPWQFWIPGWSAPGPESYDLFSPCVSPHAQGRTVAFSVSVCFVVKARMRPLALVHHCALWLALFYLAMSSGIYPGSCLSMESFPSIYCQPSKNLPLLPNICLFLPFILLETFLVFCIFQDL